MNLAMLGMLAVVTALVAMEWQQVIGREIRWSLDRLRDDLRMLAIEDRSLLDSELFWRLDRSLTGYNTFLEDLSLWVLLPLTLRDQREVALDARSLQEALGTQPNRGLASLYHEASDMLVKHLFVRHWLLVVLALISGLGIVVLVLAHRRSRGLVTSALLRPSVGDALIAGHPVRAAS